MKLRNPFEVAAEQGVCRRGVVELARAFCDGVASDVWRAPQHMLLHGLYFAEWRRTHGITDGMPLDFGGGAAWHDLRHLAFAYLYPPEPGCYADATCVA